MLSKRFLTIVVCILLTVPVFAQERIGLTTTQFSGINGISINPSSFAFSPLTWDAQLVSVGAFFDQNHLYFENTKLADLFNGFEGVNGAYITEELPAPPGTTPFYFYEHERDRHVYLNAYVEGPAAAFRIQDHNFGFSYGVHVGFSTRNVASHLPYPQILDEPEYQVIDVPAFEIAGMAWTETKLNYSRAINNTGRNQLAAGATLKFLGARQGIFFNVLEDGSFMKYGDTVEVYSANVEYGYVDNSQATNQFEKVGSGFGIDLGISGVELEGSGGPYKYKWGISVLDLGKVGFKENAQTYNLVAPPDVTSITTPYENVGGIEGFNTQSSLDNYGSAVASEADEKFSLWLPTALSVQGDMNLGAGFYMGGLVVQRIPLGKRAYKRSNIIAASFRYENRWFALMPSANLYESETLKLGTAVRLGPLTVGSEDLMSIVQDGNFTGTDVYMALKLNNFMTMKRGEFKSKKKKNKDPLSCPQYNF